MSDASDTSGDLASALEGLNPDLGSETSFDGGDPNQGVQATDPQQPKLSAFATNYLANVPEEEHELVIRHIQEWDKGFQNYAQRVAQQQSQYQQLGSIEELQQARTVAQMIADDPRGVTQWLIEQGYGQAEARQAVQQAGQQQQEDPFGNLPPAVRERLALVDQMQPQLQRYETALGAMYQNLQLKEQEAAVAVETEKLENQLAEAHAKHGNFDEYLVLLQMREGVPLEDAIAKVGGIIQGQLNQRAAPQAPRVMSSRSLPPQHKSVSDMSDDERISALAQMVQGTIGQ